MNTDSGEERTELIRAALHAQKQIFKAFEAASIPYWLELELSLSQVKTLFMLAARERMTVNNLASALHIGQSATSLLIERLVHNGLVERSEDGQDRRRTLVYLSPVGQELMLQLRQGDGEGKPHSRITTWMAQLNDADLAALVQGLKALAAIAIADETPIDATFISRSIETTPDTASPQKANT